MARLFDFSASKAIAATTAQTVTFTAADIPSAGVVAYVVMLEGSANTLADLTRIRLKADGTPIIDVSFAHFQAFIKRLSHTNEDNTTSEQEFIIPLYVPDAPTEDAQDLSQFPRGMQVQLELETGASTGAGFAHVGFIQSNIEPMFYPTLIGQPMNIAASATQQRFNLSGNRGQLRGFGIETTGISRMRVVINNHQWVNIAGDVYRASAGNMMAAWQSLRNVKTLTDPDFFKTATGQAVVPGASFVELTTDGTWSGATSELSVHSLIPQGA